MAEDARARYVASKLTERRWKQADLVRETGLDKNTISDFMTGKRAPSTTTLTKIEDALDLTRGTLTGGGEDSSGRPWPTDEQITDYERQRTGAAYLSDEELLAELTYRFRRMQRQLVEAEHDTVPGVDWSGNADVEKSGDHAGAGDEPVERPATVRAIGRGWQSGEPSTEELIGMLGEAARHGRKGRQAFEAEHGGAGEENQDPRE